MKTQIFIHITHNQITNKRVIREAFEQLKDGRYLVSIATELMARRYTEVIDSMNYYKVRYNQN